MLGYKKMLLVVLEFSKGQNSSNYSVLRDFWTRESFWTGF